MKTIIKKPKLNLSTVLLPIIFFSVSAFVFFIYSIDLSCLILALFLFIYAKFFRKIEKLPSYVDLLLLTSIAVVIPLLTTVIFEKSGYFIPAIGFIMLVTLLFDNLELSLLFSIFISYLSASVNGGNFNIGISLFSASLCVTILSYRLRRRAQIIKAGVIAGFVQFFIAFIVENYQSDFTLYSLNFKLFESCLINGFISSIVVIGILPIFEFTFKVVTNISLLELSDFNHTLLRRMILEAPGTYQHSLVVANLAEAASESIGANPLLARVGAYYHDIGKIPKANYFVENQIRYRDVHKDLKPSISKLIIINHVKEGVELAKKHRLNPRIIDFVEQHHGKSLVYYFYHRAKELEPDKEKELDKEYRYPGPRPQSKEVAMVSLADNIEAFSRTLEDPTPSRIEEMVRSVVRKKFIEGELDESNLTLRDLGKIIQSFVRILNAVFHTRINYPKDENSNKKPSKNKENKPI
ncbi:MAG: HDIG domain-containing protein [Candidatus Omnitrophica bacterium]|nr:HDIG domain-containing protein [Candidatus Omnitrophota bacterium]